MKDKSQPVSNAVHEKLKQLDIQAPSGDLPFLQQSFLRQQEFLRRHESRLAPESEPAHVFKAFP